MPRNSSGTYTLPAGNPVVPNTLIDTNWANPTMSDLGAALTDSLDRNGRGGMLAPLKLADGTVTQPAFAFNSESSTGLYRPAAGTFNVAVLGALITSFTSAAVTFSQPPTWAADPASANQLTRKSYVDAAIATAGGAFLPLIGGTLTGPGNLTVAGTLGVGGQTTVSRPGGVNTNSFLVWTDQTTSTGYLSVRSGGSVSVGSDGPLDFSTGQSGVTNAFNLRMRIASNGQAIIGAAAPLDAVSALTLVGSTGSGQLTIQNGTAVSFYGGGTSLLSAHGTSTNTPFATLVNNVEAARFDTSRNFGIGTTVISSFGHGGTNVIEQILSPATSVNAQAHLMITSGFTGAGGSSIGTICWGLPGVSTGALGRVAMVQGLTGADHTTGAPTGYLSLQTKGATDASTVERMRITQGGLLLDAAGLELGFKDIPRTTGGFIRGQCFAISGGQTINTAATGTTYSVYNDSAANVTLTQGAGLTLRLNGTTTTGNRTLLARGFATVWFNAAGEAIISGAIT